jgi:hypothetical protein
MSALGLHLQQYFYYLVAYHQFKQSRFFGWVINRIGGYSILREGNDLESMRVTARILADGERPLVLFPEGTWFRQNDRLGPIQEGLCLMVRQAVQRSTRPIVIHPIALKYWLLEDPRPALQNRLAQLEARLGWRAQAQLDFVPRIEKLASALLALKELEQWGEMGVGTLDERIARLADSYVEPLERTILDKAYPEDWILKRARRLRRVLVRQLIESKDPAQLARARNALDSLLFVENLTAHSHAYLTENPSLERLVETVQRIEETVTDEVETPVVPVGVCIRVGPAIDVTSAEGRRKQACEPLLQEVASGIQGLLDNMVAEGPPPAWHCPSAKARTFLPA